LAPIGDQLYHLLRPTLAAKDGRTFAEDHRLAWHPAASALADLHTEGKVSVLPAVGYTHPDQSHFTSRLFWEVGALDPHLRTGWVGRVLDVIGTPDNPLQRVSLDGQLSPTPARRRLPGQRGPVPRAARRLRRDGGRGPADPRRLDLRAGHLRHACQPGRGAAGQPQAHLRLAARLPARPRGARAGRPRAHARVV